MRRDEETNWVEFRGLPYCLEEDFHSEGRRDRPYYEVMADVENRAFEIIKAAQAAGLRYVLFTHGSSTSRPGQTTARSVIRGLIRSKATTPYINRRDCIQQYSVFVVALRRNPAVNPPALVCPKCGAARLVPLDVKPVRARAGVFKCGQCRALTTWLTLEKHRREEGRG
jgi:hypothetical protein